MVCTISSTSLLRMHSGNASTSASVLSSAALPSMTGIPASGPISPRPSTALPSVTTGTQFHASHHRTTGQHRAQSPTGNGHPRRRHRPRSSGPSISTRLVTSILPMPRFALIAQLRLYSRALRSVRLFLGLYRDRQRQKHPSDALRHKPRSFRRKPHTRGASRRDIDALPARPSQASA